MGHQQLEPSQLLMAPGGGQVCRSTGRGKLGLEGSSRKEEGIASAKQTRNTHRSLLRGYKAGILVSDFSKLVASGLRPISVFSPSLFPSLTVTFILLLNLHHLEVISRLMSPELQGKVTRTEGRMQSDDASWAGTPTGEPRDAIPTSQTSGSQGLMSSTCAAEIAAQGALCVREEYGANSSHITILTPSWPFLSSLQHSNWYILASVLQASQVSSPLKFTPALSSAEPHASKATISLLPWLF